MHIFLAAEQYNIISLGSLFDTYVYLHGDERGEPNDKRRIIVHPGSVQY